MCNLGELMKMSDRGLSELREECELGLDLCETITLEKDRIIVPFDVESQDIISIMHDVRTFDWEDFASVAQFDVVLMDPPWRIQVSGSAFLELTYELMAFEEIASLPINILQTNGFVFLWTVVSLFERAVTLLGDWGYRIVTDVNWLKVSRRGRYQPSSGFYVQHAKETCLVAVKGTGFDGMRVNRMMDMITKWRNVRQSHKPHELYEAIEETFPGGLFLEVFARSHNLRPGWVSLGLEVPQ
jgi:N6-adenosine-specific RNA methylase IME4